MVILKVTTKRKENECRRQEKRREKYKTDGKNRKQMFREINPNRGTITLNVNVLNIPIKSQRFSKWIKILKTQLNTAHKRQPLNIQMQKD